MVIRHAVWLWVGATTSAALLAACSGPSGCTKDTDCKGNRVCTAGQCVDTGSGGGAATGGGSAGSSAGGASAGGGSAGGGSAGGGSAGGASAGGGSAGGGSAGGGSAGGGSAGGAAGGSGFIVDDAGCNVLWPEVASIVALTGDAGWAELNRQAGMVMFGCDGGSVGRGCLSTFPPSTLYSFSSGWNNLNTSRTMRILREYSYDSAYLTRSAPDGRFVAHGGKATAAPGGSTVHDLVGPRTLNTAGQYIPGFFPDNSAFLFHGAGGGARLCPMSLLRGASVNLTLTETGCSGAAGLGLNPELSASLQGAYSVTTSNFEADDGNIEPARFAFGPTSQVRIHPVTFTGSGFVLSQPRDVPTPNEGDVASSPSGMMIALRKRDGGYALRTPQPDGGAPMIGNLCGPGAQASFSYDERYLTYHHFVTAADYADLGFSSPTDNTFMGMIGTASNIYVIDLLTGTRRAVTVMSAGQRAVFPHFRSDGWLYFVVKDTNRNVEDVVASDIILP